MKNFNWTIKKNSSFQISSTRHIFPNPPNQNKKSVLHRTTLIPNHLSIIDTKNTDRKYNMDPIFPLTLPGVEAHRRWFIAGLFDSIVSSEGDIYPPLHRTEWYKNYYFKCGVVGGGRRTCRPQITTLSREGAFFGRAETNSDKWSVLSKYFCVIVCFFVWKLGWVLGVLVENDSNCYIENFDAIVS